MPKLGMEPVRRAALVRATIDEIGATGTLDITVSKIAKRAGMSSALAHHYFGGKDQIFLAAMRHTLTVYGREVRAGLAKADGPKARLEAIIRASFTSSNFRRDVIAAWLNFYVLAQSSPPAQRLLSIYQRRLHSNLVHDLRPLIGARAGPAAQRIAGLIDGLYLRQGLARDPDPSDGATRHVLAVLTAELKGNAQ
ncbi:choline-binding transcriptional repressor BetI [Yoonia sediminilitoris]|uniref:HTH-type transcriptional regulator BetI n=1 Tax=Yoonia sediminilitoris TaxID=1286148 RepID=A0A2T6KQ22_9RHOB|nr:transcriptional regulator BetI [Yoonia sediminilitoris]PUB18661.1 TetR family transcriptional regulator [Yoonia sediminilitoris]RCW98829.1 TetR family transcriptional regulator [Yoonia sediminilitoris]